MGPSAASANLVKGGAFLVLAVLMFDTMGAIVKYLSANYPPQQLSLFRNLFGLLPRATVLFAPAPGTRPVGRGGSGNGGWAWRVAALSRSHNSVFTPRLAISLLPPPWPSRDH